MNNFISTHADRVYLIKLAADSNKYFVKAEGIPELLKKSKYSIEYIKEFDPPKERFKRVSKAELKNFLAWHTETINHPQIKSYLSIK